jgi:N-acetylmuramic acid 6-phosphate etherase
VKSNPVIWNKLKDKLKNIDIEQSVIGEITGGDRAMVSSLEGFEDLQSIGQRQLQSHHIQKGDVIFAVTEGGETSSVIGTILAETAVYEDKSKETINEAKQHLYFVYNNPNNVLMPLDRSRSVLENDAITKISLPSGPQAIAGSTRMQASTISTFVIGAILEEAIYTILKEHLSDTDMAAIGFSQANTLQTRLLSFLPIQKAVYKMADLISNLTDLEYRTYIQNHFAIYFALDALVAAFIDSTERSPTFNLEPLDTVKAQTRKSWIQVWTDANDYQGAWQRLLRRDFQGLDPEFYRKDFLQIPNPYLREAALRSLENAGKDQELLYDFSYSTSNIQRSGPAKEDLGVIFLMPYEADQLQRKEVRSTHFLELLAKQNAATGVILVVNQTLPDQHPTIQKILAINPQSLIVQLPIGKIDDPLGLRQQVSLKMLLNAHSTAVMVKLGRVVGNTMTAVRPGNLKLIGRATYLIQSHVNDALMQAKWPTKIVSAISYNDANAVLFDVMDYIKQKQSSAAGQQPPSQVALAIIRILEALKTQQFISWEQAENLLQAKGLEQYLLDVVNE